MNIERKAKLEANIWKLQVWEGLTWTMLFMPIFIPFLIDKGLSLPQAFSLQAIFAVTIVVLEMPSGYFADIIGRKHSFILGSGVMVLAVSTYSFGQTYIHFIIAEMFWGVGAAFISGAKQALLYDTLIELGRKKEYVKINGRLHSINTWSEGIGGIIGGFIALISLTAPFWVSFFIYVAAFIIAITFFEPKRKKMIFSNRGYMLEIFLDTIHRNKALKWIIAFGVIISIGTRVTAWLYQPSWIAVDIPIHFFGILWAITLFISGIGSWIADRIDSSLGRHRALIGTLVIGVAGYLLGALLQGIWILLIIPFIQLCRGLSSPLIDDEINVLTSSDRRATVNSIFNLGRQLVFACVITSIGIIAGISISWAFWILFIGVGVLGAFTLIFALRNHRHSKKFIYK